MNIKRCTRCVMDNSSDNTITFDENGVCNYCRKAEENMKKTYFPNEEGELKLKAMLDKIKSDGIGKKYDCLMGISGGLDSCYLAYLGAKWNLRILAVHIDDGFDTNICKNNIEKLVKACNIDFRVIKPDSEQFNDLSKAYLKAGVPNIAVPQDNVLFAFLYSTAKKEKIKYFLSGGNFALECILQQGNTHDAFDLTNIKDIHKKFGTKPINKLKLMSTFDKIIDKNIFHIQTFRPLDLIDYNRDRAFNELKEFCGFEYYGRKHLENIFTAFAQLYWFPKKFGVDKRTSHLSSMIISGQMTREEALKEIEKPIYEEKIMDGYLKIVKDKLKFSEDEFDNLMSLPSKQHTEYKTNKNILIKILRKIKS